MSYVSNEIRDKIMEKVLAEPSNRLCFDCNSKEPKWSSPYLGIILCYDCAARHRSYGTHISFVRSVDLDKWNKKQLKSIEISGNSYTKERFNELGIPKIGNIYDYNNDLVLKYRAELAEKVKEELENENEENDLEKKEEKKNEEKSENVNINNEIEKNDINNNNNEEVEEVKNEIEKPTKFEINKNVKLNNIKVEGKGGKKNKIKKVDFDFNFDSFDTMNFSDFNKKNEEDENDNKMTLKEQLEKESKKQKEENKKIYGNTKSYDFKYSEEEINKKFANKKAISSEDYAALEDDGSNDNIIKNKIKSMGNSQAISSEDIYGRSDDYAEETFGEKLKDFAINFTLKAAEKAKEYKNKANEYINKMQNKLGGSG
jgi:hypothetical protein